MTEQNLTEEVIDESKKIQGEGSEQSESKGQGEQSQVITGESQADEDADIGASLKSILGTSSEEKPKETTVSIQEFENLKAENQSLKAEIQQLRVQLEHPTVGATISLITENPEISTDAVLKAMVQSDPRNMSNAELYAEKTREFYKNRLSGEDLEQKVAEKLESFGYKDEDEQEQEIEQYRKARIEQYKKKSDEYIGKKKAEIEQAKEYQNQQMQMFNTITSAIDKVATAGKLGSIELEPDWKGSIYNLLQNGIFKADEKGNIDLAHALEVLDFAAYSSDRKKFYKSQAKKEVTIQKIEQHAAKAEVKAEQQVARKMTNAQSILEVAEREANKNKQQIQKS